ncbi:MAG: hypothetical protein Q9194_000482 [Teloschistes cf. exilis]
MERFGNITQTEYLQQANDSLLTIVQIETRDALHNVSSDKPLRPLEVDAIAKVPGIDVLFCGPFDLGNNIGHPILDGTMHDELKEAVAKIQRVAKDNKKASGIYATSGDQARQYADQGFNMVSVATDAALLPASMESALTAARGSLINQRLEIALAEAMHKLARFGRNVGLRIGMKNTLNMYLTDSEPERVKEQDVMRTAPLAGWREKKGWNCCKPRVLTFDEFLSIPPCTTGKHSTVDDTPAPEPTAKNPISEDFGPPPKPIAISNGGTEARSAPLLPQAPQETVKATPPPPESDSDDPLLPIPPNKTCRRRGCNANSSTDERSSSRDDEKCIYHPGQPIFHEGSKGWSCCKRRVLEFDEFMKIEGCKRKKRHMFVGSGKNDGNEEALSTVRHDFYQTPTTVIASYFLKKIDKERAKINFSSQCEVILDLPTADNKRYKTNVPLFGQIDTTKSTSKIMGTKLELTLAKLDGASWPTLRSDETRTNEITQIGPAGRA